MSNALVYGTQWRLFANVLDKGDDMHVETLCWEPGGCSSDQTIVRLNVDTGVVCCFLSSLLRSLWTSISSPVCHLRGTACFDSPHCWKHRYNTIIHYKQLRCAVTA